VLITAYDLRGFIVADIDKPIYDLFGVPATSPADVNEWIAKDDPDCRMTINSYGGDLFAASEIFSAIAGKVDVEIVGLAASSAGLVAMGGKTVKMVSLGEIMIHNVSSEIYGDYRDMEKMAVELKTANESVKSAYLYRCGMNCTEEDLQNMMDAETWLTAKDALAYGFIDEVMFQAKGAAYSFQNAFKPAMSFYNSLKPRILAQKRMKFSNQASDTDAFLMQKQVLEFEKIRYGGNHGI
jgi:ATP-dependent protease ClpP protease subunit